jgi:hypothetical protein
LDALVTGVRFARNADFGEVVVADLAYMFGFSGVFTPEIPNKYDSAFLLRAQNAIFRTIWAKQPDLLAHRRAS